MPAPSDNAGPAAFWLLVAAGAAVVALTFNRLPGTIATHFDAAGRPNGWSSPIGYLAFLFAFAVAVPLAVVGLVDIFARRAPGLLNFPHREFWLAEPRRVEGLARLRAHIWWLAGLFAASAVVVHLSIVLAHRARPPRLSPSLAWATIGLILAGFAVWMATLHRRFRPHSGVTHDR